MSKLLWYIGPGDLSAPGDAAALHSREDVRGLRKCGWDARLYSSASGDWKTPDGVVEFIVPRAGALLGRLRFEMTLLWMLVRTNRRPDFLFFRGPSNLLLLAWTALRLGVPIGIELNGVLAYRYKTGLTLRDHVERLIDRFFMRHCRVIVGVTEELSALAASECNRHCIVVTARNGVNTEQLRPVASRETSYDLMFGFLGKAYEGRSLELALDVIAALDARGVRAGLSAIGGGPEVPRLQKRAEALGIGESVTFSPVVPPDKMAETVAHCHLMWAFFEENAHIQKKGLSPLKIWTYLALGKPVFAREISVLTHYRDVPGIIWTRESDAATLAEELLRCLQELGSTGLNSLGTEGRAYVESNISWQRHADIISTAIERSLSLPPSRRYTNVAQRVVDATSEAIDEYRLIDSDRNRTT